MIVDTLTLAKATGVPVRTIQRLAKDGTLTPLKVRTGLRGRPSMWFDLDTAMRVLDKRSNPGGN